MPKSSPRTIHSQRPAAPPARVSIAQVISALCRTPPPLLSCWHSQSPGNGAEFVRNNEITQWNCGAADSAFVCASRPAGRGYVCKLETAVANERPEMLLVRLIIGGPPHRGGVSCWARTLPRSLRNSTTMTRRRCSRSASRHSRA
jgi:hypothetical protein